MTTNAMTTCWRASVAFCSGVIAARAARTSRQSRHRPAMAERLVVARPPVLHLDLLHGCSNTFAAPAASWPSHANPARSKCGGYEAPCPAASTQSRSPSGQRANSDSHHAAGLIGSAASTSNVTSPRCAQFWPCVRLVVAVGTCDAPTLPRRGVVAPAHGTAGRVAAVAKHHHRQRGGSAGRSAVITIPRHWHSLRLGCRCRQKSPGAT
jgi:hypothetical protein